MGSASISCTQQGYVAGHSRAGALLVVRMLDGAPMHVLVGAGAGDASSRRLFAATEREGVTGTV